jgi:hypothetical protein
MQKQRKVALPVPWQVISAVSVPNPASKRVSRGLNRDDPSFLNLLVLNSAPKKIARKIRHKELAETTLLALDHRLDPLSNHNPLETQQSTFG